MLNSFSGIGQILLDPKISATPTGLQFAKFILAIPREKKDDSGKPSADKVNCCIWGKAVESFQYCEKGDLLAVSGAISTSAYKNSAGAWVNTWEVAVNRFYVLRRAGSAAASAAMAQAQAKAAQVPQPQPVQAQPVQQVQQPPQAVPIDEFLTAAPSALPFDFY